MAKFNVNDIVSETIVVLDVLQVESKQYYIIRDLPPESTPGLVEVDYFDEVYSSEVAEDKVNAKLEEMKRALQEAKDLADKHGLTISDGDLGIDYEGKPKGRK